MNWSSRKAAGMMLARCVSAVGKLMEPQDGDTDRGHGFRKPWVNWEKSTSPFRDGTVLTYPLREAVSAQPPPQVQTRAVP